MRAVYFLLFLLTRLLLSIYINRIIYVDGQASGLWSYGTVSWTRNFTYATPTSPTPNNIIVEFTVQTGWSNVGGFQSKIFANLANCLAGNPSTGTSIANKNDVVYVGPATISSPAASYSSSPRVCLTVTNLYTASHFFVGVQKIKETIPFIDYNQLITFQFSDPSGRQNDLRDNNGKGNYKPRIYSLVVLHPDVASSFNTSNAARTYGKVGVPFNFKLTYAFNDNILNKASLFSSLNSADQTYGWLNVAYPSGLTLNNKTGVVTWIPQLNGLYAVSFLMQDFTFGTNINLDTIFEIKDASYDPPYLDPLPEFWTFYEGFQSSFQVTARHNNPARVLTIEIGYYPANAVFASTVQGKSNNV